LPVSNFTKIDISDDGAVWLGGVDGVVRFEGDLDQILPFNYSV